MIRKFLLPLLAVGLLAFAVGHAIYVQQQEPQTPPPVPPPTSPFGDTVAGAGMVEPSSEASTTGNIAIGSQLAGIVAKVSVSVGQTVKKGDLLVRAGQTTDGRRFETSAGGIAAERSPDRAWPRPISTR